MELQAREFADFQELVHQKCGISLGEGKEALVATRIGKRMRALGIENFRSYLELVQQLDGGEEMVHMLDAISTNVTSFFREPDHFDFIREAVARWRAAGQRRFRFWSAACSSGEEPYTLAMTLCESGLMEGCDTRILATDISTRILEAARQGVYPRAKVETLPGGFGSRCFEPVRSGSSDSCRIREHLRRMVVFSRMNLAEPPFPMQGPLDIILVRNVMIYFDNTVRKNLLAECQRLLRPGGFLVVGHAESLTGLALGLKAVKPSVYVKAE